MTKNIGIDLGFGFVKATNGEKDFIFPSVVGAGQDLTYRSELTTYVDPIENLSVSIEGKKYFVGDLAIRQSEILSRSLGENHAQEKNTKILLLTALALFVQGDSEEFNVVTGLPPSYYLAFKDELAEMVKGNHSIIINTDGTDRKKTIVVDKVKIIPQPLGTLFQKLFNQNGVLEDKDMARSRIGIIDVGFRTTDFAVADKLEYIDKMSYSTATGMSNAYGLVSEHLRNQFRIYKENFELDEIIQEAKIKIAGKVHDLTQVKKEAFEQVAAKILTEMNSIWDRRELDLIFVSGGGGKALADYLLPELETAVLIEDSQIANVHGYLKLAQKVFGISADAQSKTTKVETNPQHTETSPSPTPTPAPTPSQTQTNGSGA
ncbi:MAG TPA: ParM/StbA family protein, partial [Bacillota bacterium]|nr:ParM/StbA family protein [Bacillota bacterium]